MRNHKQSEWQSGKRSYIPLADAPFAFRALMSGTQGMVAAWAVANLFWGRSGPFGDLVALTMAAWMSSACAAAAARRPFPQSLAIGVAAGSAFGAACFLPLHRPGWLVAGIAASILAAALCLPFATYGDIALASRSLVRAAMAVVVIGWGTYLVFVRPLSAPTPAGQAVATVYPCVTVLAAVATARSAHRLTYGARARRAWLVPVALAVAFRDAPGRLLRAVLRLSIATAGLIAVGTALVAILPRIVPPRATPGKPNAAGHPPVTPRPPAALGHTSVPMPLVLAAAAVVAALAIALAWVALARLRSRALPPAPAAVPSRIRQRRLETAFRLLPTSHPVRIRMQHRLRAWHRAGRTIGCAETIRSLVSRLPDELRDPGDPALLVAYEESRYGPDEP
ncbi:hypothetical protein [Alicyclobacillus sendaiensis]|uniref:DUF4129 domain-containing protein n=1 Tax=Alicyclobacillus sendaiensis PA2 TaxID=3029425 RepID=A0ABT6XZS7_ALISE|nr:hypothetical protein [Alicyclobacillus sendaiensis]MDI9260586.1 hypothetical protein [Alicyclobacillus sendaiensis PA2]